MRSDARVFVCWGQLGVPKWGCSGSEIKPSPEHMQNVLDALENAIDEAREEMDLTPVFRGCQKCKDRAVSLPSGTYSTLPTHEQKLRAAELILKVCPEDDDALRFLRLLLKDSFTVPAGGCSADSLELMENAALVEGV